jgi:O-antigen ligase
MRVMAQILVFILTGVVLLLLQPVFLSSAISGWITAIVIGVAVISYFRPHNGLLILAALVPLGPTLGAVLGVRIRESEALVLAFLAGVLLRGWALHQFRDVQLTKLHAAALLFGSIVAASCLAQIRHFEAGELGVYVTHRYLSSLRGFSMIFSAMLLVEGVALVLYAAHHCRTRPWLAGRLMRMLVIGGLAAAAINLWFFVHELIETGAPLAWLTEFLVNRRWSAHVGDMNAAGSYFAMVMFMALGAAMATARSRWAWGIAGFVLAAALWLTSSRAAITAAVIVTACWVAKMALERSVSRRRLAGVVLAASVLIAAFAMQYFLVRSGNATPSKAVSIRLMFLETTGRMLREHPVFGVGVGQYARWSTHFSSPELLTIYVRENAHNNFAQIAGELGILGLASFIAFLTTCLMPARRYLPVIGPVIAGLAAFIVSWLGGHPLLVPEVAYPFWLTLAIIPGVASDMAADPHA